MIHGLEPSLAQAGRIKIGGLGEERPKKSGDGTYRLPVKYEHFLLVTDERDENGDLKVDTELMDELSSEGEALTAIPICLHSDEIDEVFTTTYAWYHGRKQACRGDGKNATQWAFKGNQRLDECREIPCPCDKLGAKNGCKPHGTLHCSIMAPEQAVAGAVHRWRTTSIISIQQMIGSLLHIKNTCGVLQGLPLWLVLKPVKVRDQTTTVYCCHVELRAKDINTVQQQALEMARMRNALSGELEQTRVRYKAMLEAPEDEGAIADEFQPHEEEEEEPPNPVEGATSRTEEMKEKLLNG
jgi:hypothetical protein